MKNREVVFDVETDGLNPAKDKLVLVGYKLDDQPIKQYRPIDGEDDLELRQLLRDPTVLKVGHNVKFDSMFLHCNGYEVVGPFQDTRILAYLANPFQETGLKELASTVLGKAPRTFKDLQKAHGRVGRKLALSSQLSPNELADYNANDIEYTAELDVRLFPTTWYERVEKPLIDVLFRMEQCGIYLNTDYLKLLDEEFKKELEKIEAGFSGYNLRSPSQVKELLSEKGFEVEDTAKHTLKQLAWSGCGVASELLHYREVSKLQSTYITPLLSDSDAASRIHGSFNQAGSEEGSGGTKTGRLTSRGPNLQNIPARSKLGKKIRAAFIPSPGYVMFDSDLKQIEPRLIAHYSQAPKLIDAYNKGLDTHGMFAADIYGKPIAELTKMERFIGKTSWLASVYGCSHKKLKVICETNSNDPIDLDEDYFKQIQGAFEASNPEIYAWRRYHIERTRRCGFIETYGGRKIKIANLNSKVFRDRLEAERMAVNYLIQGSASDIMKMILLEMDRKIVQAGKGHLLACVHDEILGELFSPDDLKIVQDVMCNTCTLTNVKIDGDTRIIENWSQK